MVCFGHTQIHACSNGNPANTPTLGGTPSCPWLHPTIISWISDYNCFLAASTTYNHQMALFTSKSPSLQPLLGLWGIHAIRNINTLYSHVCNLHLALLWFVDIFPDAPSILSWLHMQSQEHRINMDFLRSCKSLSGETKLLRSILWVSCCGCGCGAEPCLWSSYFSPIYAQKLHRDL